MFSMEGQVWLFMDWFSLRGLLYFTISILDYNFVYAACQKKKERENYLFWCRGEEKLIFSLTSRVQKKFSLRAFSVKVKQVCFLSICQLFCFRRVQIQARCILKALQTPKPLMSPLILEVGIWVDTGLSRSMVDDGEVFSNQAFGTQASMFSASNNHPEDEGLSVWCRHNCNGDVNFLAIRWIHCLLFTLNRKLFSKTKILELSDNIISAC